MGAYWVTPTMGQAGPQGAENSGRDSSEQCQVTLWQVASAMERATGHKGMRQGSVRRVDVKSLGSRKG
jgi:hypothetical protein